MRKLKMSELNRISVDEFKHYPKTPVVIVLDNVRSLHNIGSVFRLADAFRLESIFLCGITGKPPSKEINKTALGATESVKWEYAEKTMDALYILKNKGFLIYALEQAEGSISLDKSDFSASQKIALVFGNEVHGVSDEAITYVDGCIEIPQFGTKHSLNIAVSAGIAVWELFRQMCK